MLFPKSGSQPMAAKESGGTCHHGVVFDVNQAARSRVECRLTCHRLCSSTPIGENCKPSPSHKLCRFRQNMMETTTKKRKRRYDKDWETTYNWACQSVDTFPLKTKGNGRTDNVTAAGMTTVQYSQSYRSARPHI